MPETNPDITVDAVRDRIEGTFPGGLGITPVEVTDEHAVGRIKIEHEHLHPGGYVHGGVWTALGDTVAAWITLRHLEPGWDFTTVELKLNVFAAGIEGDEVTAVGMPMHVGRSTAGIEVRMHRNDEERLAANLILTQFLLPPASEKGGPR